MISLFYGIFLPVIVCFQIEAFLFNTKPHHCNTRVSVCLTCERPGFHPEMYCNNVTTGDYCFTKIVHNSSGIFTTKGSASSAFCDANKYQGSLAIPACRTGNIQEGTECVDCCKQYNCDPRDNYCNKHIIQDIHTPFTVTTPKTTPTVITTALPTTASTTTTPPSTSTPQRGGLCEVCVEGNGLSCGPARNHYCSKGENYCMNTVISDPRAGKIVVKKCADEVECKWNYWVDTLGDPKCSNVTGPQEDNACNYCCDNSDDRVPCNQDPIPKHLSTFDKPQEVKQCITGNSNSHFQLENCPPTSSYCLNEVRYDTTAKHPETLVIKRCALEAECKGLWWEKTRKRHECLTQNFTGITDQNIVCTFCCVSENGVCNGASVPDQIALFTPVATTNNPRATTARPTSTSTVQTTIHDHGHHNTHTLTNNGHHHTDTRTTSTSTTTTLPTTTTSPISAPIMCSGNRSVVCEDDPKAPCATLSSFGLCTHLQYNPDSEDIKFCPKTCNLCDKYCEYVLRTVPPATVSPPTFSKTTQRTTIPGVTGSVPITTQYPTLSPTSSQSQGLQCPSCDMNLTCVGYQTCSPEEVCMILPNPGSKFLTHCSMKENCTLEKIGNGEIYCCSDRAPCPTYDINYTCEWNQTCGTGETCMARGFTGNLYHFKTRCTSRSECLLIQSSVKHEEVYCCDDRECLRNHLGLWSA